MKCISTHVQLAQNKWGNSLKIRSVGRLHIAVQESWLRHDRKFKGLNLTIYPTRNTHALCKRHDISVVGGSCVQMHLVYPCYTNKKCLESRRKVLHHHSLQNTLRHLCLNTFGLFVRMYHSLLRICVLIFKLVETHDFVQVGSMSIIRQNMHAFIFYSTVYSYQKECNHLTFVLHDTDSY